MAKITMMVPLVPDKTFGSSGEGDSRGASSLNFKFRIPEWSTSSCVLGARLKNDVKIFKTSITNI